MNKTKRGQDPFKQSDFSRQIKALIHDKRSLDYVQGFIRGAYAFTQDIMFYDQFAVFMRCTSIKAIEEVLKEW